LRQLVELAIEVVTMTSATPIVFIVDDDVSVRESLELLIESAGWHSRTFASAEEFLAHTPVPTGPSCLVVDVNPPDFSGLKLQESLVRNRRHIPVIFISGYDADETRVRAIDAGAVAFLTKPLNAGALLNAIEHAIKDGRAGLGFEGDVY
jgi:FixJ family two-component response regulator